MTRLNRSSRQSPTDLDVPDEKPKPTAENMQFDYRHRGGATPWPERHKYSRIKVGPGLIRAAWKAGLIVLAEVHGFPNPVAVRESRWFGGVFEVLTLEGYRIPSRLFTRTSVAGLSSTGEYIEGGAK